ncbi:BlaI/MecI/CopY family transcriptional regulator [Pelomonas sp. SE-A7]|uniref:BlaI/MecI/CopY family transcriptional regulator n=1 Tax=Pelomonas sp. SE-A7 TaxID=3054953 RepID=UPI00259D12F3|nr:BlaI/MecI/CopY family transcriptional regulator [Pelomonas sp. SE-A7]MDM4767824.1 BlaI/MecI/CopY family transcriptional regulator [Pelomonas sp. SE-A7]
MDEERSNDLALSELQLTLMRVLWARGEASTAEVVEALHESGRPLAHTTVATLLSRLEKRGLISASRDGRQLRYVALVDEPEVQRSMVSGLLSSLFQGQPSRLMSHLLSEGEIADDDLAEMRKLLSRRGGRHA